MKLNLKEKFANVAGVFRGRHGQAAAYDSRDAVLSLVFAGVGGAGAWIGPTVFTAPIWAPLVAPVGIGLAVAGVAASAFCAGKAIRDAKAHNKQKGPAI